MHIDVDFQEWELELLHVYWDDFENMMSMSFFFFKGKVHGS